MENDEIGSYTFLFQEKEDQEGMHSVYLEDGENKQQRDVEKRMHTSGDGFTKAETNGNRTDITEKRERANGILRKTT